MDKWNRKIVTAVTLVVFFLFAGTVFYHLAEGWRYVDAFYFTGTTLTTVGYGDLAPTHDFTKIITVFFMFVGISLVFYSVGIIAQKYFEREEERLQQIWESTRGRREEMNAHGARVARVARKIQTLPKKHVLARMRAIDKKMTDSVDVNQKL
jgi:hypothetical protein